MKILKWMLGLLLAANLMFLVYMQWGGALTGEDTLSQSQSLLHAEKIKLVNIPASSPEVTSASGQPDATPLGVSVAATQAAVCMQWGEFSGTNLARATDALAVMHLGDRISQHQAAREIGYWVYMPPQNSRADVDRKILQLRARGVTDYFIVQDSTQWQNAISLGIFKTEESARLFLDKLKAKGVRSAVVGERDGTLKFTVFDLKNLDPALSGKISVLQKQFPESELKIVPCSTGNAN